MFNPAASSAAFGLGSPVSFNQDVPSSQNHCADQQADILSWITDPPGEADMRGGGGGRRRRIHFQIDRHGHALDRIGTCAGSDQRIPRIIADCHEAPAPGQNPFFQLSLNWSHSKPVYNASGGGHRGTAVDPIFEHRAGAPHHMGHARHDQRIRHKNRAANGDMPVVRANEVFPP